jgi:aldose sugar dehydrogenase
MPRNASKRRETGRVRDVRQGPDGAIWFLSVNEGAVFKMTPDRLTPTD